METKKTICPECWSDFLQSTADSNGGYCLKCKPRKNAGIDHEEVAGKMELSLRLIFAFVFAFVFALIGYGLGALIWSGIGIILAAIGFPIGFFYGLFCKEINFVIRAFFRSLIHFEAD